MVRLEEAVVEVEAPQGRGRGRDTALGCGCAPACCRGCPSLTICTDEECVAITTHQLEGRAKSWWDNYTASHPNPAFITWLEFCEAFREQYLPSELLIQKAQEFCTMTRGTTRVEEYELHFMKMMQYAPMTPTPIRRSSSGSYEAFTMAFARD
jgi:hypothetical protein